MSDLREYEELIKLTPVSDIEGTNINKHKVTPEEKPYHQHKPCKPNGQPQIEDSQKSREDRFFYFTDL